MCINVLYVVGMTYTMLRVDKKTARELRKVCGDLQGRDGFYTTYNNAIIELIHFWREHKGIEKSLLT